MLIEHERQIHDFLCLIHIEIRLGRKVDVTVLAVQLREALERFTDLVSVENVAFLQRKRSRQQLRLENQSLVRVGAAESELAHVELLALLDGNHDVGLLPVPVADDRHPAVDIHCLHFLRVHHNLEKAVILVQAPDAHFEILIQLRLIERLAHHRNVSDAERNAVRPVILHRADDFPGRECLVSHHRDRPDFHLRAFVNIEDQLHGVRCGDALIGGFYGRELVAVRRQQALDYDFGALDLRRVELTFHAEPDFLFLKGIEDVGLRDRFVPLVFDPADDRPFLHVKDDDFPVRSLRIILHLQGDVLEKLRVPQRLKIAMQSFGAVGIALA